MFVRFPALPLAFLVLGAVSSAGCMRDPDCGVCDPDRLVLQMIGGTNYAGQRVLLLSPPCEGPECPAPFTRGTRFVDEVVPCLETPAATAAADPEEWCKLSPLVASYGLEFVFNNLLEADVLERVRRRPDDPNLFEVHGWTPEVLQIEGPISRYRGEYLPGSSGAVDRVADLVSLSCETNVEDYDPARDPEDPRCDRLIGRFPAKMELGQTVESYPGRLTAFSNSCAPTGSGPDTCCTVCDWTLTVGVERYGRVGDEIAAPGRGALTCDPEDDPLLACRDFRPSVDRSAEERRWYYRWDCDPNVSDLTLREREDPCFVHRSALEDKLRETHPQDRPTAAEAARFERLERLDAACTSTRECETVHGLTGTQCVGTSGEGDPCSVDSGSEACTEGVCRPEWFVTCRVDPDTTGAQGYCVDRRFVSEGTGACAELSDARGRAVELTVACDFDENGRLTAAECCDGGVCDPFYDTVAGSPGRAAMYDRDRNLGPVTRDCRCVPLESLEGEAEALCRDAVEAGCYGPDEDGRPAFLVERAGQYAVQFVEQVGGVIYDPSVKGFLWLPADTGGVARARIEACAETASAIGPRNHFDGWRAHDDGQPETDDDFDRALCSGQSYTVVFAGPEDGGPYLRDKAGNTLEGKAVYGFETAQFHVMPDSGAPRDSLRIGACGEFSLGFSNKYDLSAANLRKLMIQRVDASGALLPPNDACGQVGAPVAGGPGCHPDRASLTASDDPCAAPCLTLDVTDQRVGKVQVSIDPIEFGNVLALEQRYRLTAPSVPSFDAARRDPAAYRAAFWDACGMPLVDAGADPYQYDFTIDPPSCREDVDRDGIQLSCDNAADHHNPEQGDLDADGFGDVVDLCPLTPTSSNTADADRDGVGNDCDNCREQTRRYNEDAIAAGVPFYMEVRNIPMQTDTDQDGIGDVCDNCVQTPNCGAYGPEMPYTLEAPIDRADETTCQRDDDHDMVGDACGGDPGVGLGDDDDFDGDGVRNRDDGCPRQPLADAIPCTEDEECPEHRRCALPPGGAEVGLCNHLDSDGDTVGNVCDTCPFAANVMQLFDGEAQAEDEDGDFVGLACETTPACADTERDPRPFGFFPVSAHGLCCTVSLLEAPDGSGDLVQALTGSRLVAPHPEMPDLEIPVRIDCASAQEDANVCRRLPPSVAALPGVLAPPPGCEEALAAHPTVRDPVTNLARRLELADVDDDLDALWATQCFLPQFDQDFDGLGDACDLCPFDFDPENQPYVDDNGRLWPMSGRFCNGAFSVANKCESEDGMDPTTGTGGTGDGTGGGDTGEFGSSGAI